MDLDTLFTRGCPPSNGEEDARRNLGRRISTLPEAAPPAELHPPEPNLFLFQFLQTLHPFKRFYPLYPLDWLLRIGKYEEFQFVSLLHLAIKPSLRIIAWTDKIRCSVRCQLVPRRRPSLRRVRSVARFYVASTGGGQRGESRRTFERKGENRMEARGRGTMGRGGEGSGRSLNGDRRHEGPTELLAVARRFRESNLSCDHLRECLNELPGVGPTTSLRGLLSARHLVWECGPNRNKQANRNPRL